MKINLVNVKHVLEANDIQANKNREIFKNSGVLTINLISSPGSGKTTLLEKTLPQLSNDDKSIVVVGDLETTRDAQRLTPHADQVTQINTGSSCHLYANQITESLKDLSLDNISYLFIENVGNIVCPGEFDLGENLKVVLLSVPEGDDKVAKYPTVFRVADLVLLTKVDLLDVLDFNVNRVRYDIEKLNSNVPLIEFSSKSGVGINAWLEWLRKERKNSIGTTARCACR